MSAIRRRSCGPAPSLPTSTSTAKENGVSRGVDTSSDSELRLQSPKQSLRHGRTTMPTTVSAETIPFLDCRARVLVRGDDTDGAFDLVEMSEVPAGSSPPLHVHHTQD